MSRRKSKPSSPAEIAERRRVQAEGKEEAQRLRDQGAEVVQDQRTQAVTGAYKPDVVVMMSRAGEITPTEEDAVRRFEALIAKAEIAPSCGLGALDRVHGGDMGDRGMAAHIQAAKDLLKRRDRMDSLTWSVLRDLCGGNLLVTRWRQVIEAKTGETNPKAQAGIVRQAFRVLAIVEDEIRRARAANDDRPQDGAIPLAG